MQSNVESSLDNTGFTNSMIPITVWRHTLQGQSAAIEDVEGFPVETGVLAFAVCSLSRDINVIE
jgi:hypothetical protein